MIPLIEQHRAEIEAICRQYGVAKLELFGSAARGRDDFDPVESVVDFFYEFAEMDHALNIAERFFGMWEDLQSILGRKVDMVSAKDAKNPYFLQVANRNRITLYAP